MSGTAVDSVLLPTTPGILAGIQIFHKGTCWHVKESLERRVWRKHQ